MRFDGFVHNRGPGALELNANNRVGAAMTSVTQRIYDSGGGVFEDLAGNPVPQVLSETDDSHNHWHLKHIARYSMWTADGTAEVRSGARRPASAWLTRSGSKLQDRAPLSTPSAGAASATGEIRAPQA